MVAIMKLFTATAVAATALGAPGNMTLPETIATDITDHDISLKATIAPGEGYVPDSCEISCHLWYRFCQSRPYNYKCKDDGRFKWGRYHGGCSAQCFCRCDSQ